MTKKNKYKNQKPKQMSRFEIGNYLEKFDQMLDSVQFEYGTLNLLIVNGKRFDGHGHLQLNCHVARFVEVDERFDDSLLESCQLIFVVVVRYGCDRCRYR